MIARCLEQQWKGYSPWVQDAITAVWHASGQGTPGCIGSVSDDEQLLWYVLRDQSSSWPSPGLKLMSIKTTPRDSTLESYVKGM